MIQGFEKIFSCPLANGSDIGIIWPTAGTPRQALRELRTSMDPKVLLELLIIVLRIVSAGIAL